MNPIDFWEQRGKFPADTYTQAKAQKISTFLSTLNFESVFEVGAGDGQLTDILLRFVKEKNYLGYDFSEDRTSMFLLKFGPTVNVDTKDITQSHPWTKFDLVICAHTLVHIEPEKINLAIENMLETARKYLVLIEPCPGRLPGKWTDYCFEHDYRKLLRKFGYEIKLYDLLDDNLTGIYWIKKREPDSELELTA